MTGALSRFVHGLFRVPQGITARISVLSWTITLSTLLVFVAASVPEQKRDLLEGLQSKALGISSSLHEVTAGAAITGDFSSLVDHCVQVLAADKAIEYVVVTKADGFSIIIGRTGWRTAPLDSFWRPAEHIPHGEIVWVPEFGKRAFHFAVPFDYSSIRWGWINVGLSIDAYDRSVAQIYTRTAILAIFCVGVSLFASIIYARQLVRPVLSYKRWCAGLQKGTFQRAPPFTAETKSKAWRSRSTPWPSRCCNGTGSSKASDLRHSSF